MEQRRFSGKTVEEATDNALEALDVNLEDVEIVVVNPGRSGILGFGGEPAEIDVALLEPDGTARNESPGSGEDRFAPGPNDDDEYDDEEFEPASDEDDEFDEEPDGPDAPVAVAEDQAGEDLGAGEPDQVQSIERPPERPEHGERPSEPDPEVIEFASEVIDYFLASMSVVADTYIRDETDDGVPVFDIEGEDSGLLIGRRGETLQSFQYLVNLIVTHQLGRSAYVQIDVEGYKERRRETLTGVAQRTAERVADSGDAIELEPMPAYERRWVHMALANSSDVRTESSGEGSDRFVVVYPQDGEGGGGSRGPRRPRERGGRRGRS